MKTEVTDSELVHISEFLLEIKADYKDNPNYTFAVITLAKVMNARYAENQFSTEDRESIVRDIIDG